MQVLNAKERRKAFWMFLLMLIFTLGFAIFAAYFTFNMPRAENKKLRELSAANEKEMEFQTRFSAKMIEAQKMLDSINNPGANSNYLDQLVTGKISELQKMLPDRDTLKQTSMYNSIISSLLVLQDSKKAVRGQGDITVTYNEYKIAIEKLQSDNNNLRQELQICRQMQMR